MRLFISVVIFCSILTNLFSQNNWKSEYKRPKVFIENKGQFDDFANTEIGIVLYAVDFGKTKILFGQRGVSYSFLESEKIAKVSRGEVAEKLKANSLLDYKNKEKLVGKFLFKSDELTMLWKNSNPCNIIPANKI
jgi:hypothetical protein